MNPDRVAESILQQLALRDTEAKKQEWLVERLIVLYNAAFDEGWDEAIRNRDE